MEIGSNAYVNLHNWVRRKLGKPQRCEICGTTEAVVFDWANLSGEYKKDLADWRRLCRSCHINEKNIGHCVNWHETNEVNTYTRTRGNECRTCNRAHLQKWRTTMRTRLAEELNSYWVCEEEGCKTNVYFTQRGLETHRGMLHKIERDSNENT